MLINAVEMNDIGVDYENFTKHTVALVQITVFLIHYSSCTYSKCIALERRYICNKKNNQFAFLCRGCSKVFHHHAHLSVYYNMRIVIFLALLHWYIALII